MEFEFDKEMDALLQSTRGGDGVQLEAGSGAHLDADEISIFAENALNEEAKPRVIKHLADCERCRTILSNTILLNAEADEKVASLTADMEGREVLGVGSIPWYKNLFGTRNLAYGLGAMVLLFAGMFGFLALQNSFNANNSELAKASESDLKAANTATSEAGDLDDTDTGNSNVTMNFEDTDNDRLETSEVRREEQMPSPNGPRADSDEIGLMEKSEVSRKDNRENENADGVSRKRDEAQRRLSDESSEEADEQKVAESSKRESTPANESLMSAPPPPKPKPASAGRVLSSPPNKVTSRTKAKKKLSKERDDANAKTSAGVASADKKATSSTRKIGGKTFTRKDGIWYDAMYKGQTTTNVRRKTNAYKSLDSGLRSIADKLSGTAVVVWKSKAYRID